ncbi:HAMP domain-containing sensor histidine kinase [Desulfobacterales bacterium HSG17]|nr:HAMP domain-containing sensor histidine kinase [Desulfobacterales bacterium HSG17]
MRHPLRIFPYIIIRVLPLAIIILLGIWFTTRTLAQQAVRQEVNERLAAQAAHAASETSRKLSNLVDTVKGLAANNIIVNGLIDTTDRAKYLPTFIQSLWIPGPREILITMSDYRGRHIISNKAERKSYADEYWIQEVMNGKDFLEISLNRMIIAVPILYSGMPEGILIAEYGTEQVSEMLEIRSQEAHFEIKSKQGELFFASEFIQNKKCIHKQISIPGFESLVLICSETEAKAFRGLSRLDFYLLLAMVFDLLALVAGIVISAQLLAKPLSVFLQKIDSLGRTCSLDCNISETGPLEVYLLTRAFNKMLIELEEAQKEMVENAIESGRAQLAAVILHNIGNAVTPMKVLIESMKNDQYKQSAIYMEKCYIEMKENAVDLGRYVTEDTRGKEIFKYLGTLIDAFKSQNNWNEEVIEKLENSVSYVSEILSVQNSYTSGGQMMRERVDINSLIEDTINIQASTLEKREITVKKELMFPAPELIIDKNRLLQVLVNFLKNSYEAIDALEDESIEPEIIFKSFSDNELGQSGFEILDTGIGIEPEKIESIFEFGNSGKDSSGFGLYYCRMFVEANRGTLDISSPGIGKGSTIRVSFKTNARAGLGKKE